MGLEGGGEYCGLNGRPWESEKTVCRVEQTKGMKRGREKGECVEGLRDQVDRQTGWIKKKDNKESEWRQTGTDRNREREKDGLNIDREGEKKDRQRQTETDQGRRQNVNEKQYTQTQHKKKIIKQEK